MCRFVDRQRDSPYPISRDTKDCPESYRCPKSHSVLLESRLASRGSMKLMRRLRAIKSLALLWLSDAIK